jgi:hypothetical protein
MTGQQVNDKLERGIFGATIRQFACTALNASMQKPSDPTYATGVNDSVTQQANRIDAAWDNAQKKLTLSLNPAGPGYWIPYIGNGVPTRDGIPYVAVGVAQTAKRGLGAYTPVVGAGAISWVATGPFSGCSLADYSAAAGRVFAHLISPAEGYTAATIATQNADIAAQTGAPAAAGIHLQQVVNPVGEGYVFWTLVGANWYRRIIYVAAGNVTQVDTKVQI